MKKCALFVMVFLVAMGVRAQDETPQYRLRVPTAEEYLAEIPEFSALDLQGYEAQNDAARIVLAAEAEFFLRYGQDADFELLERAYNQFSVGVYSIPSIGSGFPAADLNQWNALMIQAWLSENPTELDDLRALQFSDYTITVEQRDFTGDSIPEWLLDVTKGVEEVTYRNYLVAVRDGEGYRIVVVPITWSADHFDTESPQGNAVSEVRFEDINEDGVPEWVLSRSGLNIGPGYTFYFTSMYVFSWRGSGIEEILFVNNDANFENLDADAALELRRSEYHHDNWNCGYTASIVYDWNGETYVELPSQIEWGDCTARHAEEAMWAGDFATAATLYDTFVVAHQADYDSYVECTHQGDYTCGNRTTLIFEYFLVRRIIAYALLGNASQVSMFLAELSTIERPQLLTQAFLEVNATDAATICLTAYNYYANLRPLSGNGNSEAEMYTFIPGELIEDVNLGWDYFYGGLQINPARAGCDINALNGTPIPTVTPTYTPYPTLLPPTPDTRSQEAIWIDEQALYEAFRAGSFETVVTITQTPAVQDEFQAGEMCYYRAMALEALNRPDEALAEYIAIFSAAPESAWGQLAALHLERVD